MPPCGLPEKDGNRCQLGRDNNIFCFKYYQLKILLVYLLLVNWLVKYILPLYHQVQKLIVHLLTDFSESSAIKALKCGIIPKHVAFIMDGNRRYARKLNKDTRTAHIMGSLALRNILHVCHDLDICQVTIFAFSIENFKRLAEEIDVLMTIASDKLSELLENDNEIHAIGNLTLLPLPLQALIRRVEELSKDGKHGILRVCLSYTATNEISTVIQNIVQRVSLGELDIEKDVNLGLLESSICFDGKVSNNPDLIIRTSGETRLSDFLLWQCSASYLVFLDVFWPEFSNYHLYKAILGYQEHYNELQAC